MVKADKPCFVLLLQPEKKRDRQKETLRAKKKKEKKRFLLMHELKKEEKHPRKKIWIGRKKKIIEILSAFNLFFLKRERVGRIRHFVFSARSRGGVGRNNRNILVEF